MDSIIKKEFDRCEAEGCCRSDVAGLRMKWIDGPRHMIAQYHPTWQIVKRKSDYTHPSMKEPFSHAAFNFTKVKKNEVLAKYYVKDGHVIFIDKENGCIPEDIPICFTILLNVSPICNNHHLIIPNLDQCYPQVWRDEVTSQLITICTNSERDDFVLFFNSLGGFSSVNHLHFQVMYTSSFYATATGNPNPPFSISFDSNKLPVEYEKSTYLLTKNHIEMSHMDNWLSQTMCFHVPETIDLNQQIIDSLAEYTNLVIQMCYEYEFPYDVIMCNHGRDIFVFIRKYQQTLDDLKVNPACVELTGIVVYRSEETFDNANEEVLMKRCEDIVHFEKEVWNDFVQSFKNRVENK